MGGPWSAPFPLGLNPRLPSMPNRRQPPRPNLAALFHPYPSHPPTTLNVGRNQLISLSRTDHIFQAFYTDPHVFSTPLTTNRIRMELEQQRDVLIIGQEFQYRVRMFPMAPSNVHTQNQAQSPFSRENVTNIPMGTLFAPTPHYPLQMKILAWNCRGAASDEFFNEARNLISRVQPHVFIVMETKLAVDRSSDIANRLFFDDCIIISAINAGGGMWVLWNSSQVSLSQIQITTRTDMLWLP